VLRIVDTSFCQKYYVYLLVHFKFKRFRIDRGILLNFSVVINDNTHLLPNSLRYTNRFASSVFDLVAFSYFNFSSQQSYVVPDLNHRGSCFSIGSVKLTS